MAKPRRVTSPGKVILRKKHGPKKKHPVGYSSTLMLWIAKAGLLKKRHNPEAMKQSLDAKKHRA